MKNFLQLITAYYMTDVITYYMTDVITYYMTDVITYCMTDVITWVAAAISSFDGFSLKTSLSVSPLESIPLTRLVMSQDNTKSNVLHKSCIFQS